MIGVIAYYGLIISILFVIQKSFEFVVHIKKNPPTKLNLSVFEKVLYCMALSYIITYFKFT